ncbi:MAG TPA: type II CAAX endopeptidase family protein [Blastocatellia bacterium]
MKPKKPLAPFVLYVIGFFAVWTAWVLFGYPRIVKLGDRTLAYALVSIGLRLILWVIPVFLYLKYIDRVEPFDYLGLKQYWKRGVVVGLAFSILSFLGAAARHGHWPHPSMQAFTWNSILSTSILIGFLEEIPFRGFMLQKIEERTGFWMANLISGLLFLSIHFPGWISLHLFKGPVAISVFVLGVLFAILFHYTKSLWSAIVAHSLTDFISAVLF